MSKINYDREPFSNEAHVVPIVFMQDAVAASQSAVALPIAEVDSGAGNAVAECVLPYSGYVLAVSYALSAAGSAGALSVSPTINGTVVSDLTINVGTNQRGYDTQTPNDNTYLAPGDRVGVKITTDGSWSAETMDLAVTVWVLLTVKQA